MPNKIEATESTPDQRATAGRPPSALFACPFCGSTPELHRWTNLHRAGEWSRVECACGIRTSALGAVSETIRRWNTRSQAKQDDDGGINTICVKCLAKEDGEFDDDDDDDGDDYSPVPPGYDEDGCPTV